MINEWILYNTYRALVKEGKAKAIRCPECSTEFSGARSKDLEFILRCYGCGLEVEPGITMLSDIKAVVGEHRVVDN